MILWRFVPKFWCFFFLTKLIYFVNSQEAQSLRFYNIWIYFEIRIKYKFILFSCSSLLFVSSSFSFVLSNSHNLLQSGQISEGSRYGRKTLLFSLAGFNLKWLIQHITDGTVLVANEELASSYGKGIVSETEKDNDSSQRR